ncbi:hypothetical protein [Limnoglobus roseus]|uniref:Uncharacterized protein n=1 Tax=Limnoglobus roseus TaxID=2598579 RepID=A0A5C1ALV2_9BACT|nr:hypothetical protein [Limnoglobus roseus]QEL18712.1 hypothetical protein PX52LOC_05748 [Limnoglobus roseus]
MTTLTLGGIVFAGFEIPETINFGGQQMLVTHKQPGGKRVIDAMGPDDDDVHWSGRFRGDSAEERALLLDFMRRAGKQLLLTWSLNRYQVVIRDFKADFHQPFEIPYSITCQVVTNETQVIAEAIVGFIEAMAGDLAEAVGLSSVIASSTISTAVGAVATAFTNYQAGVPATTNALAGATAVAEGPLLASLQTSITSAQATTQGVISTTTAGINTAPVSAGGSPSIMGGLLSSGASGFSQLGNLYQLNSVLARMGVNTANKGN